MRVMATAADWHVVRMEGIKVAAVCAHVGSWQKAIQIVRRLQKNGRSAKYRVLPFKPIVKRHPSIGRSS